VVITAKRPTMPTSDPRIAALFETLLPADAAFSSDRCSGTSGVREREHVRHSREYLRLEFVAGEHLVAPTVA
jgi:hypothetical protein